MPGVTYIFYPGGNVSPITLGDDDIGNRCSSALCQSNPQVERRPIAGASTQLVIEHLNNAMTMSWTVDWDLLTAGAAFTFKATHAAGIGVNIGIAQGVLQEMLDDGTVNFYQQCSRPKAEIVSYVGQNVVVKYTVQYGYVTDTINSV